MYATTTYEVDRGRVIRETDALDQATVTEYDAAWNITSSTRPVEGGTATTTYTFDAKGNPLTETEPITDSTSLLTVNTYNATNDLLTRTDADWS